MKVFVLKYPMEHVSRFLLFRDSFMEQWVKDPVLSLQRLGSLLWCGFNPWPGKFHISWAHTARGKKKKKSNFQPLWRLKYFRCFRNLWVIEYQFIVFFFFFLRLHLWHMEVPRLGVESELQAYAKATVATPDLSHICDSHHSLQQHQILKLTD